MKTNHPFGLGLAATFGLSALLFGLGGAAPAHADDWNGYGRGHIYRDIQDVRRDERVLRDLQARHDEARRCHDWDRMHALDRQISDLRRHIDNDRRDIRRDVSRDRDTYNSSYRYRDSRYGSGDAYRRDRTRYRDDRYNDRYDR